VKHLYYPLYLAAIAVVVLFNLVAAKRRLSPRLIVACNIAWGLATCVFMFLNCEPKPWFQDFRLGYWEAGRKILTSPGEMYGIRELHFVNLPVLGLLCVPFGFLEEYAAGIVFAVLSLGGTALAWWQLCRLGGHEGKQRLLLAWIFVFSGPLFYSLREGNATTLMLPVLAAALAALLAGRPFRSGALLGVAALIKPPLLLLPAYYAFRRRGRVAAGSAAVVVPVVLLSLLLFGTDLHRLWYERCLAPYARGPVAAYNSQSVTSFLARFWAPGDYGEYWGPFAVGLGFHLANRAAVLTLGAGVLLLCMRPGGRDRATTERLDFSLVLSLALLSSPICWTHYLLLLLLPFALLLGGKLGTPPTRRQLVGMGLAFLLMSLPVRAWALRSWYECVLAAHPFAGAVVLLTILAAARWRLAGESLCSPRVLWLDVAPQSRLPEVREAA
jgi:hypothetical protein